MYIQAATKHRDRTKISHLGSGKNKGYNLIINTSEKKALCYVMCRRIIIRNPKVGKTGYVIILTYSLCHLRVSVSVLSSADVCKVQLQCTVTDQLDDCTVLSQP